MSLDPELRRELDALEQIGRRRELSSVGPCDGLHDFASNDYLGLARDAAVVEGAVAAVREHGAGARAARLLGGGGRPVAALEEEVADWLGDEASLMFPTGYQANLGVVGALVGRGDVVVSDRLIHASTIDAIRLSRADARVHDHLDVEHAAALLGAARGARRRLLVTDGVFSMDGDRPDLQALIEACERHDAWLVVDEAHAAGMLGPDGAGACAEAFGREVPDRLVARVVTGGKALGAQGAFVTGSRALRDVVLNRARSFVFTTAAAPAVVGALRAALERVRSDAALRARPLELARRLAAALGLPVPAGAIVPVLVGGERAAIELQRALAQDGFDVRAVRPPTVPEGACRIRVVCHADQDEATVDGLAGAIRSRWQRPTVPPASPRCTRPWFVCGTDTGVGKTVVSALLVRALSALGRASYWKPVQTGTESDTETVSSLAPAGERMPPAFELPLPASPHEAARAAGATIRLGEIDRVLDASPPSVVELAGGLLVPYGDGNLQIDWIARRRPRIALVARSSVGTLNHTLLSLEALRRRGLEPEILFVVGEPHASNAATLRELGGVVATFELPRFESLDENALESWLRAHPELEELLRP